MREQPNVVFVFADQMRAHATGYAGDQNVQTPYLDQLHRESISFANAVSNCPVCTPARASLLTGQYPLSHRLFMNDIPLETDAVTIGKVFRDAGYDTGYIGKWHVNDHGWMNPIPRERRQGFDFWRVLECTHDYNNSYYYDEHDVLHKWEGYDVEAQTRCAAEFIRSHGTERPFLLMLSWGPPHGPYHTAPERFRKLYDPERMSLRPNVPDQLAEDTRRALVGYYSHITALDTCLAELNRTIEECDLADDTIFVFTSDHGDHLGSHGRQGKQTPWDESILVPFLLRYPRRFGRRAQEVRTPFGTVDIMPTLLGLCGIPIPDTVEGLDFSRYLAGESDPPRGSALVACYHVHGTYKRYNGKDYRGIRTERYTYVRDVDGPWLLYDNERDPYQLDNLCNRPEHRQLQAELEAELTAILAQQGDEFLPGDAYARRWGYELDPETGRTVTALKDIEGMNALARADQQRGAS